MRGVSGKKHFILWQQLKGDFGAKLTIIGGACLCSNVVNGLCIEVLLWHVTSSFVKPLYVGTKASRLIRSRPNHAELTFGWMAQSYSD